MKAVIVAVLIVLVVSHSEALRCKCGGRRRCSSPTETCFGSNQVCANIVFKVSSPGSFKGCYDANACVALADSPVSSGYCCRSDLCN